MTGQRSACTTQVHPLDPSRAAAHALVLPRQVIVEFEIMTAAAACIEKPLNFCENQINQQTGFTGF
jgi:hypothetical protein